MSSCWLFFETVIMMQGTMNVKKKKKFRIVGLWVDVQTCDLLSMKQICCPLAAMFSKNA